MKRKDLQIRTATIKLHPTRPQTELLYTFMRSSAGIYNTLIFYLDAKSKASKELKQQYGNDCKPWEIDPFCDIRRKYWARELIAALFRQDSSVYPREYINKPANKGKRKGEERIVVKTKANASGINYGIPSLMMEAICADFEANVDTFFALTTGKRKNGEETKQNRNNKKAKLPYRYKGLHTLFFPAALIKVSGSTVTLGSEKYGTLTFQLEQLQAIDCNSSMTITRSRSGDFYLHVVYKTSVPLNPDLTEVAAVDFGQKRAIVIAAETTSGQCETAHISGKNILALKRERENRYREINRARSSTLKGQIRQYLSPDQKEIYRKLQLKDDERQRNGLKRSGSDIKYALRIINQKRSEQGLKKYSRRQRKLNHAQNKAADYYRRRLKYANHAVAKAAVDWAIARNVGTIYLGKLNSIPKGRKKGGTRIKQVARNNRWEMPTQAKYINEKLQFAGGEGVKYKSEAYTSQECPNCHRRHKPTNRIFHCKISQGGCGWIGDRDDVGSANFLSIVKHDGELGLIKPVKQRILRMSPAIRQDLRSTTPNSVKTVCEPVEAAAKVNRAKLQVPPDVAGTGSPKTARNARRSGKTLARGGQKVLAKLQTLDPGSICDPRSNRDNRKTGELQKDHHRCLQNRPQTATQLTFW